MADPFDLDRFVAAQDPVYGQALAELRAGAKRSHWMWFVFPQIAGLGFSPMAQRYAIASREEARAYLAHAVLGPRLAEATAIVTSIRGRTVREIFGTPDDMKFRSSMTLFSRAAADPEPFERALATFFEGQPDPATLGKLG